MKRMDVTILCGGHLAEARSIPGTTTIASAGTFGSAEKLQTIYVEQKGIDPNQPTIAYRRIPGMHQIVE